MFDDYYHNLKDEKEFKLKEVIERYCALRQTVVSILLKRDEAFGTDCMCSHHRGGLETITHDEIFGFFTESLANSLGVPEDMIRESVEKIIKEVK